MAQASFDVNTLHGFDAVYFYLHAASGGFFADMLADPEKPIEFDISKKNVEFSFFDPLSMEQFTFELSGKFNARKEEGRVEEIVIFRDGVNLAEVKNPDLDLKDLTSNPRPNLALIAHLLGYDEKMIINGNRGDDVLIAHAGEVHGARGDDVLYAFGRASLDGGSGSDWVTYGYDQFGEELKTGVTASLTDSSVNKGIAKGDSYVSIENLSGSDKGDTLIGSKGTNHLEGRGGDDTLVGGAKGDKLDGGDGIDIASYISATAGVKVYMSNMNFSTGDARGDKLISIEGVAGSALADTLVGDAADNMIMGNGGDDFVDGGNGADELWGDNGDFGVDGADTFAINGYGQGVKKIMDFDAFDHIQIKLSGFGLSPDYELLDGVTYVVAEGAEAAVEDATFLFDRSTNQLMFDADGSGEGEAILLATVKFDQQIYLDINDFTLV